MSTKLKITCCSKTRDYAAHDTRDGVQYAGIWSQPVINADEWGSRDSRWTASICAFYYKWNYPRIKVLANEDCLSFLD